MVLMALLYRFTFGLRKAPGQKRKTQFVMLTLLGSGILLLGATSIFDIASSKRLWTEGQVADLRKTTGKNSHSVFNVLAADGSNVEVNASYEGVALANAERVRVRYLDHTSDITSLQVLDGPYAGWSETESGGIYQALFSVAIGLSLLIAALFARLKKAPQGQPD